MKDVLDKNGINYFTKKPYSEEYKKLADKFSKLPIYEASKVDEIFDLLNNKQVILLSSGTGSGKTVLVPKFLYRYIVDNDSDGMIGITNPKTLITYSNAVTGALTFDVNLGEEVGYKYKGAPSNSTSDKTKILYLTDGLLFAMISQDKYLEKYKGIIIDEAHERNVQIDLLLKLLKEVVIHRKDFKLIIMSATIDTSVFKNYFDVDNIKYGEIHISSKSNYPITQHWAEKPIKPNDYIKEAIILCNNILKLKNPQDILIFVPTQKDTFSGCDLITDKKVFCVEMFSKMTEKNKELARNKDLYKKSGYTVKIIFATNVAESSITFDGLVYVIDTGLELVKIYDADYNMHIIKKDFTSQAQIIQRIGRAGRTSSGESYHLYTQEQYNKLPKFPLPKILTIDLTDTILSLINYGRTINNALVILNGLITIPSSSQIKAGLHKLKFTQCVKMDDDNENGVLSRIGISISKFRSTNLLSALAIIMSYYLKCQDEMIIIMAIMEITDGKLNQLFIYKNLLEFKKYIEKYSYINSDHLTAYNIYVELYLKNKMKYLKLDIFNKINNYIKDLRKYANYISEKNYNYMNDKYFMINISPYEELDNNLLYILYKSHKYNLIENNSSVNFINNSIAKNKFGICTTTDNKNIPAICHGLVNILGKKVFLGITKIPKTIL